MRRLLPLVDTDTTKKSNKKIFQFHIEVEIFFFICLDKTVDKSLNM